MHSTVLAITILSDFWEVCLSFKIVKIWTSSSNTFIIGLTDEFDML